MIQTKIQLLPNEMALVSNADVILTKNAIMEKVKNFLLEIQEKQAAIMNTSGAAIPAEVRKTPPKISRGENYKGLPWLVLDHPRHFEPGNIFAIRTMFWWGKFFSITLHLSGRYKKYIQDSFINNNNPGDFADLYLCVNENEWQHHFEESNYRLIKEMTGAEIKVQLTEKPFLKLGICFPVDQPSRLEKLLCSKYEWLIKRLA